jgi:hypothetical protein
MVRALIAALTLAILAGSNASPASGQIQPPAGAEHTVLETRLRERFQILPLANGVVLTPKFRTSVRSIEVADVAIAVDGTVVTGGELREKLGADADLILQLSYLDPAVRRSALGLGASASTPAPPPVTGTASERGIESDKQTSRSRHRDDIVRFGGSVTVAPDEIVDGDVAVIGGSADIQGQVEGDVAVIGGSLTLGPRASIQRDVTVVGGALTKDPNATIGGKVAEVGVGGVPFSGRRGSMARAGWWRNFGLRPAIGLAGTLVRVSLVMLLAGIVMLVARTPVEQIAERAAAEPLKSWAVGLLAEILFVPVLILTVVVLAVSIIGIPLLLVVPVAIAAALVVCLVGFTGVAYHIGRLIETRFDQLRNRPYLATIAGITVIVSPLLLARLVGLIGGLGVIASLLLAIGILMEYLAWTTGLGAAALVRFGRPRPGVPALPGASPVG